MKRLYRLSDKERFREIRRNGRSWTTSQLVLCALPNGLERSRFGFSVSRRIGNAVQRNRVRRRLREAVRRHLSHIVRGWDLVFIARPSVAQADFDTMEATCLTLLRRAHVLNPAPETADATQ